MKVCDTWNGKVKVTWSLIYLIKLTLRFTSINSDGYEAFPWMEGRWASQTHFTQKPFPQKVTEIICRMVPHNCKCQDVASSHLSGPAIRELHGVQRLQRDSNLSERSERSHSAAHMRQDCPSWFLSGHLLRFPHSFCWRCWCGRAVFTGEGAEASTQGTASTQGAAPAGVRCLPWEHVWASLGLAQEGQGAPSPCLQARNASASLIPPLLPLILNISELGEVFLPLA